jgi:RNA polymerase sigma-70 factor (ECF subfamily)
MDPTPASLLLRIRRSDDQNSWRQFVELYTPLLYHWALRLCPNEHDAADLVQEVLLVISKRLADFNYDRQKSFRGWLRTILMNKLRDIRRRKNVPLGTGDMELDSLPSDDESNDLSEAEYRQLLVARALQVMKTQFQPTTWKACWEHVVEGRPASAIANELGISPNAVYVAKSRVLRRLRQELEGLLE